MLRMFADYWRAVFEPEALDSLSLAGTTIITCHRPFFIMSHTLPSKQGASSLTFPPPSPSHNLKYIPTLLLLRGFAAVAAAANLGE